MLRKILEGCGNACAEARTPLFWANAAITIFYFLVVLVHLFTTRTVPFIPKPEVVAEIYAALLAAYVGTKQISRMVQKEQFHQKRGEIFLLGWLMLVVVVIWVSGFGIGNPDVLDEIWPNPLGLIVAIFFAGEAMKRGDSIIGAARDAIAQFSPNGNGGNTNDDPPKAQ